MSLKLAVLAALTSACMVRADDWPQFRGPNRDNVSKEKGLLKVWAAEGPALAWNFKEAGTGFGGPAVVGNRVYILGALKDNKGDSIEHVIALDQATGAKLWTAPIAKMFDFKGNQWSGGPNATPSVDGDHLYALGSQGELVCVELKTGKVAWRKNLPAEMKAQVNPEGGGPDDYGWGYSWSPLVDGDTLLIAPGGPDGLLAALNKKTGAILWRSAAVKDQATYSSPIKATIAGVPQYIYVAQEKVYGVNAKDGALLWTYDKETPNDDIVAVTPFYHDGQVFITGWKGKSELFKVIKDGAAFKTDRVYDNKKFINYLGGIALVDGCVYGSHELRSWNCIDFATGAKKWDSTALGAGALTYADGCLYCVSEKDDVVALVEASSKGYKELSRFKLPARSKLRRISGMLWTYPVVANGCLYVRDQELLYCYKVKS
jgi:outer membrane protein assembly factor BamB